MEKPLEFEQVVQLAMLRHYGEGVAEGIEEALVRVVAIVDALAAEGRESIGIAEFRELLDDLLVKARAINTAGAVNKAILSNLENL